MGGKVAQDCGFLMAGEKFDFVDKKTPGLSAGGFCVAQHSIKHQNRSMSASASSCLR
jgi:hypothetical protein